MDAARFDGLVRSLFAGQTRRAMLGLGGAGLLGALGLDDANAKKRKRKHKHKKKCKKCGPCAKCKKGKCKPKKAGTPCGAGRQCFADGTCQACDVCLGDCAFTSLQDAIDAAGAGARIQLCPGRFSTNAEIVRKELTLVGAGSGKGGTILDGYQRDRVLFVSESELDARHFTVTGGLDDLGGGILGVGSEITLEGVQLTGNEAERVGGGILAEDSTTTLIGSHVTDNSASDGGGIYTLRGTLRLTAGTTVTGNTATGDPAYAGGVFADLGGTVEITGGSRVSNNTPVDCAGTEAC